MNIFTQFIFAARTLSIRNREKAEAIPERMSDDESTRYGFPEEECNVDYMERIMVKFLSGSPRNRYNNYNVLFIMWIFNKGETLNKI